MDNSDDIKIQRIIKYFKDRQGTVIERTGSNMIILPWMQWQDRPLKIKVIFFNGLPKSVKCTVDDIADVDAVMFVMETLTWHDTLVIKSKELEKHVDENGKDISLDIANIPASSYILFNLAKAYAMNV